MKTNQCGVVEDTNKLELSHGGASVTLYFAFDESINAWGCTASIRIWMQGWSSPLKKEHVIYPSKQSAIKACFESQAKRMVAAGASMTTINAMRCQIEDSFQMELF